jgi:hypothetical protein
MQSFTLNTPKSVKEALGLSKPTKDHFHLFDSMAELGRHAQTIGPYRGNGYGSSSWYGNVTFEEACDLAIKGDMSRVAKSDALMSRYEALVLETHGRAWRDDVVGALPNVPAFIAGHPLNMRRRVRQENAAAPIAIMVDCCVSAGVNAEMLARRGAAILALVRILAGRRPVELWACTMVGGYNPRSCVTTATRIETAPLDLGQAAFALTHPAFLRRIGFAVSGHGFEGHWPYNLQATSREIMAEIIKPALSHVGEALCIPGMYFHDPAANEPEAWLAEKLEQLLPRDLAA